MRKGIHEPNAATERISAAIASFNRETFSTKDVRTILPDLKKGSVSSIIAWKARQGWLERCGHGQYRIGGVRIKTRLPRGMAAEALWAVLTTDPERRFKRMPEIVAEAEQYVGRPGVSLYYVVNSLLSLWHKHGYLERTGNWGEYAYRLGPDIKARPTTSYRQGL